jgi:hypothetical protein
MLTDSFPRLPAGHGSRNWAIISVVSTLYKFGVEMYAPWNGGTSSFTRLNQCRAYMESQILEVAHAAVQVSHLEEQ